MFSIICLKSEQAIRSLQSMKSLKAFSLIQSDSWLTHWILDSGVSQRNGTLYKTETSTDRKIENSAGWVALNLRFAKMLVGYSVYKIFPEDVAKRLFRNGQRMSLADSENRKYELPAGIVGGGSECTALSPPSTTRLRCPWARHWTPKCSPGRALQHEWLPTAQGVCSLQRMCTCMG